MEHLAELLLKLLILVLEAYTLYKLDKTLKALVETRNLDQRPQNQLEEAKKNLSDKNKLNH
jgi:hypothetical protein